MLQQPENRDILLRSDESGKATHTHQKLKNFQTKIYNRETGKMHVYSKDMKDNIYIVPGKNQSKTKEILILFVGPLMMQIGLKPKKNNRKSRMKNEDK